MSFDTLPRETLLQIGSLLPQSSLNALLQVRRSVAVLLTSQLYNRHFPFNFKDRPRADATIITYQWLSVVDCAIDTGSLSVVECVVDGLKAQGENFTSSDRSIVQALHRALYQGNFSLAEFMFDHGVELSGEGLEGRSLMEFIVELENDKTINLLINYCGKSMSSDSWERLTFGCSLFSFKENTFHRLVKRTVATGDARVTRNHGATPLIELLTSNSHDGNGWRSNELEEIARILIKAMVSRTNHPSDTDAISLHSQTEIHYLARVTALHMATERRKHEIDRLLLENGANVFALDGFGRTPLGRVLSYGIRASTPKVVMFRKAYEALCVLLAKEMRRQGCNLATEVPDHIGERAQYFLEPATACRMDSLDSDPLLQILSREETLNTMEVRSNREEVILSVLWVSNHIMKKHIEL
ncbi:ankyrin repeat-containing domain protein [Leptodontidium sp. MPI-SDFR-AT-0119]|nr:ankyrin repeat-containing domain protein [Leptodontidium sp. MPI-SDFR-AT-0119]